MDPLILKALIESDPQAKELASAGDYFACADRCMEIAPKVRKKLQRTQLGFFQLFTEADGLQGAMVANAILDAIVAISAGNSLVSKVYTFTKPETNPDSLFDWSDENSLAILMMPLELGGCGFTQEQLAPLLNASMENQVITAFEVEYARTRV